MQVEYNAETGKLRVVQDTGKEEHLDIDHAKVKKAASHIKSILAQRQLTNAEVLATIQWLADHPHLLIFPNPEI